MPYQNKPSERIYSRLEAKLWNESCTSNFEIMSSPRCDFSRWSRNDKELNTRWEGSQIVCLFIAENYRKTSYLQTQFPIIYTVTSENKCPNIIKIASYSRLSLQILHINWRNLFGILQTGYIPDETWRFPQISPYISINFPLVY